MKKGNMPVMIVMLIIIITSVVFAWQGIGMHNRVSVEEAKFHALQTEYFNISKTERDASPTGSELNQQLVEIQNFPSELLRLKLVGVGKILTGIFILLFGILIALMMMPKRLAKILRQNQ